MTKLKKITSLFFVFLFVAFCTPIFGNASISVEINYVDVSIETPRTGGTPASVIDVAGYDHYTAEITGWYDEQHKELDPQEFTYQDDVNYIMAFTLTTETGYTFAETLEEVTVNGRKAYEASTGTDTVRYYEVTIFTIPNDMINLVLLAVTPLPGKTGKDYADFIFINTEHVIFGQSTIQNGVTIVNKTDPTDVSGITKPENYYTISFSLQAIDDYIFYPGGGTIGISGATGIDRVVYLGGSNNTIVEFDIEIYVPKTDISEINVDYNEERGTEDVSKLFNCNTDYVSIKNLKVLKNKTEPVTKLTPGDYTMTFTLVADKYFTITDNAVVTVENIDDYSYGKTYVDQETDQYCIDVTCNTTVAIKYIKVKFNPQNDYTKLILSQTDNVTIANIKVLDPDGKEVKRVTGGDYTITYTAVADAGYVISDDVRVFAVDRYTLHSDPYVFDAETGRMAVDSSLDVEVKSNNFFQQLLNILSAIPKAIINFFANLFN